MFMILLPPSPFYGLLSNERGPIYRNLGSHNDDDPSELVMLCLNSRLPCLGIFIPAGTSLMAFVFSTAWDNIIASHG